MILTKTNRFRSRPLCATTAAGASFAAVSVGKAQIVYSGAENLTASYTLLGGKGGPATVVSANLDLNLDSNSDVMILPDANFGSTLQPSGAPSSADVSFLSDSGVVNSVNQGTQIDGSSGQGTLSYTSVSVAGGLNVRQGRVETQYPGAPIPPPPVDFAPFQFTQSGNTYFGWLRLQYSGSDESTHTITAVDWAYNSMPGAPILAGQTSAVPEPAEYGIVIGAALAGWRMARRRREKRR
jgi:hypothetical protein